jgi:RNA polymerase sigma-70 factor, ECF subfamily
MTSPGTRPEPPVGARHAVRSATPGPDVEDEFGEGEVSDAELIRRVAAGDPASFEALYDRHAGAVFGMAVRVLRDPAQSEEVAQEVLVEAWRTAARFDPSLGSVRAWVVTMARRRAIDRVRSVESADAREARAAVADHTPEFDQVSEEVEARLEHERVRNCLEALTSTQRESIELAYFGGHTYREVAEQLNLPLGTVKTRLRDGLIRLRDCMGVM